MNIEVVPFDCNMKNKVLIITRANDSNKINTFFYYNIVNYYPG
ncbi:MAG TPA: hypothetical protein VN722_11755 [Hanamia sp.]|nr:hypothetical protein [Hanamia sp.]